LNRTPTERSQTSQEIRLLSDFIHELNIARRNLSLYPPSHPQIAVSTTATLQLLMQLCETRPVITLGVSPDTLYFESNWLDKTNPTFTKFARFLSDFGIAALSFHRGVAADELIRFNQILRSDRETVENCGGFSELLKLQQIAHIELTPIDYSAFQAGHKTGASGQHLWEDFLHGLLHDILDLEGVDDDLLERFDPESVAGLLNRQLQGEDGETADYQQAIGSFVTRLTLADLPEDSDNRPGEQLGKLLMHLNPQLRKNFLGSAYAALEQNPDGAEEVLENFPRELLLETLEQQGQDRLQISSRLVSLVSRLSTNSLPASSHRIKGSETSMDKDMVRARLEVLFNEENQDLYMPDSYQKALNSIFDEDVSSSLPEDEKQLLKQSLEQQSVERQCCCIIFEMLFEKLDPATEEALQSNLVELSRFFLDTGDFVTLSEIHSRWSEFLYSEKANTSIFNERVLTNQTQLTFMTEVLDGFELWGKEKYEEIFAYVIQIGEPYTELLIERLALEPKMTLRRSWMKLLEAIGLEGYPKIIRALKSKHWYLVRNLLIVLGRKPEATALKAIHQLTEHPHPRVRQEVLKVLFQHNPATANRMLLKELASKDREALLAAIQVADLSRDDNVIEALHRMLTAEMHGDSELVQKKMLLNTLAKIGRSESLPILKSLLQKKGLLLSKRQKELQQATIRALAKFPRTIGEPVLRELVRGGQRQQAKMAEEELHQLSGGAS